MSKTQKHIPQQSKECWLPINEIEIDPAAQRRMSEPWVKARVGAFDVDQIGRIVVNRRKNGKIYCADGQRRLALLRAVGWGDQQVPCEYFEGLTQQQEAALFLARGDRTATIKLDSFLIRVTAEDPVACGILRVVRAEGLVVGDEEKDGHVRAVAALERVYRGGGISKESPAALTKTLFVLRSAWGRQVSSFNGKLIEGVGLVELRYGRALDHLRLTKKLSLLPAGAPGVLARAKVLKEIKARPLHHCVAAVVVDVYNQGSRTKRLEDWWA